MNSWIEASVRSGIRALVVAAFALALLVPATGLAEGPAPAKAKAATDTNPAMNITPSAGPWRDRLRDARRQVLDATAALDDLNAQYARVLYESPNDEAQIAELLRERKLAMQRVSEARTAVPMLVDQARADGVDERVLELYEKATLD